MTALLIWVILLVFVEGWLLHWLFVNAVMPWLEERLRRRDTIQRSLADQRMQAMQAAHQLSLLAWKARSELYDLQDNERD